MKMRDGLPGMALLVLVGCAGQPGPAAGDRGTQPLLTPVAATPAPMPAAPRVIECPCCFTIVEFVRSSPPQPGDRVRIQCEYCCETLVFTATDPRLDGTVLMSTSEQPRPLPLELCAPMR